MSDSCVASPPGCGSSCSTSGVSGCRIDSPKRSTWRPGWTMYVQSWTPLRSNERRCSHGVRAGPRWPRSSPPPTPSDAARSVSIRSCSGGGSPTGRTATRNRSSRRIWLANSPSGVRRSRAATTTRHRIRGSQRGIRSSGDTRRHPRATRHSLGRSSTPTSPTSCPRIRVPTLVLAKERSGWANPDAAVFLSARIPGAHVAITPGSEGVLWVDDPEPLVGAIESFLGLVSPAQDLDRILATVLFTDIVGSTEMAARLGDTAWKELLATHDERAKAEIERHRGTYIHTMGDGLLATFDGPARAVRCAQAIGAAVRSLGFEIRSGAHTGEIELAGDDVSGIAVHIGARVAALAGSSEVLVSSTAQGPRRGKRPLFRRRRRARAEGRPRPLAPVSGGEVGLVRRLAARLDRRGR